MAQIFNPSIFSVVDTDGSVGIGWKLYFYTTGTSTPQNTYPTEADAIALTNALANPVLSLSDGRFPAIWFASGTQYKVILKDENNVTLETTDPAMQADVVGNLLSTGSNKGAGMIGFSHSATYSSSTVGKKLQQHVSVKDHPYSAAGDGVTNDTAAFQAALATGLPVFVSSGTYLITDGLEIAADGQQVVGVGQEAAIIAPVGNFDVFTAAGGVEHVGLENLSFEAEDMTGGYIFNVESADRVYCNRLRINNPFHSFRVHHCNAATFDEIYGQAPRGDHAFHLDGRDGDRSDVIRLRNVNYGGLISERTWDGIYLEGLVNTLQVIGTTFVCPRRGVHILAAGSDVGQFFIFHDLEVDFPDYEIVRLEAGSDAWFTTLYAQGSAQTEGIYIGPDFNGVMIEGAYVRGNLQEGIVIAGQDVNITNTQVVFNALNSLLTLDAVRIEGTATRVAISNSLLGGLEGVGTVVRHPAKVEDGATDIRFSNCSFYGCLQPGVLDLTTPSSPVESVQVLGCGLATYATNTKIPGFEIGTASGSGATATPTIAAGVITGISGLVGGSEYGTTPPSVVVIDPAGTGSGFVATAVLTAGVVTSVSISNGGTNYSAGSKLAFWPVETAPRIKSRWYGQPDVPIRIASDGVGYVQFENDNGVAARATAETSAVNYPELIGRATGSAAQVLAVGADTNVDLALTPQGSTGALQLGGAVSAAGAVGALEGHLIVRIGGALKKIPYFAIS